MLRVGHTVVVSLLFSAFFIVSSGCVYAHDEGGAHLPFERTLRIGIVGEDVYELQTILNRDRATQVAMTGPGSPGRETSYFGPRTSEAVVRFQEKYRDSILSPLGLSRGTGIVGPSTRAVLNTLVDSRDVESVTNKRDTDGASETSFVSRAGTRELGTHPNLKNIDAFFGTLDTVARSQGVSDQEVSRLKDIIHADVTSTSTNLVERFIDIVEGSNVSRAPSTSPSIFARWRDVFIQPFVSLWSPRHAHAQFADRPFGGRLLFSYFCSCSGTWLLTLQPLPPDYATLLSYVPGTQLHLNYNIPLTTQLLGKYNPGSGICLIGEGTCSKVPHQGLILPRVGSSQF